MAVSSPLSREVPFLSSLVTRSAALFSGLVAAAVLLAGWLLETGNREEVLEDRAQDLEHRARTVQVRIEAEFRAVANDVLFLAKTPVLRRFADAWDESGRPPANTNDLQGTFAALLEGKPTYAQTRLLLLSGEGRELIRLDHLGDQVVAASAEDLQPKGHRDYFRESIQLERDEIYLSRINLNREFGEVSLPFMPTLRAAAKVFDGAGEAFGLVVINVDLRPLFAELRDAAGPEASLYLANHEGDYLVHPDPARTFGFDLGQRHRVQSDYGPDPTTSPRSEDEIIRFVSFPVPRGGEETLLVGVGLPRSTVLSELASIRNRSLGAALMAALLAAALVWLLAVLLSRRLTKLADAIAAYEPGSGNPSLPVDGQDEVAVVSRKFATLASKIDEQVHDLENARQVAEENRRAKEDFLATLSHEIRTPMNAVTGLVHSLATDRPADHQVATLQTLQFASRKLIAVVNDVLDFSKIEAGRIEFENEPFDLHELLESVREGHRLAAQENGVTLSLDCNAELPHHVRGDSLRLYQILNNLVHNALKFTNPGGSVTVAVQTGNVRNRGINVRFEVRDTGVGMTEDELTQAFSRFGQASPETARKFGGTGLGLPIARMLVELQGGMFEAKSEVGTGSSFRFALTFEEAAPREADAAAEMTAASLDLRGIRILCVEDVASNRQVVSAFLSPTGGQLTFAANAAETIERLAEGESEHPVDLILLDLQLPDRDGASLAKEVRTRWPAVPVIGLTAQTSGRLLDRCRDAGVTTFVWKPIDPSVLFASVNAAVENDHPATASNDNPARGLRIDRVRDLFDGDRAQATRYLETLAEELDHAAQAVLHERDPAKLRAIRHRLQNGLSLIEATDALASLQTLPDTLERNADKAADAVSRCHGLLISLAAELRAASRKDVCGTEA